jgi:hypothetical protein
MLPGAGTSRRFRVPFRMTSRTSAIGWLLKIQPPVATCIPSFKSASASLTDTILLM